MELMAFSVIAAGIICLITFFLTGSIHILHIWRLLVLQTQSRCHLKAWARVVGCALLYATSFVASILSIVWHSKQTRAEELITILLSISLESCYVSLIWLQVSYPHMSHSCHEYILICSSYGPISSLSTDESLNIIAPP